MPGLFGSTCASRPSGLGRRYKTRLARPHSGHARVGCGSATSVARRFRADGCQPVVPAPRKRNQDRTHDEHGARRDDEDCDYCMLGRERVSALTGSKRIVSHRVMKEADVATERQLARKLADCYGSQERSPYNRRMH